MELSNLKEFCTDIKLAKVGISQMPPSQFRNFEEDLIKEERKIDSEEDLIYEGLDEDASTQ